MIKTAIIRKLKSGKWRIFSRKKDKNGNRKNLGTYSTKEDAVKRLRQIEGHKSDAADDAALDKETAALSKMSDIAGFLEDAGFIEAADKVYMAMDAVDGSFADDDEDYIVDQMPIPDIQRNTGGSVGIMSGQPGGGMPGLFSIDEAEKVASLADKLDKMGFYEEASMIDEILKEAFMPEMFEIIEKLDKSQKKKKKQRTKKKKKKQKQKEEAAARSNGHVGTGVTDNQNAGSFQGFSDSYFFRGNGPVDYT